MFQHTFTASSKALLVSFVPVCLTAGRVNASVLIPVHSDAATGLDSRDAFTSPHSVRLLEQNSTAKETTSLFVLHGHCKRKQSVDGSNCIRQNHTSTTGRQNKIVLHKQKFNQDTLTRTNEITERKNTSIMKNRKLKSAGIIVSYRSFLDSPIPPAASLLPVVVVESVVESAAVVVAVVESVVESAAVVVRTPCPGLSGEDVENQDRMIRQSFTAHEVIKANHQTNESTQLTCSTQSKQEEAGRSSDLSAAGSLQ